MGVGSLRRGRGAGYGAAQCLARTLDARLVWRAHDVRLVALRAGGPVTGRFVGLGLLLLLGGCHGVRSERGEPLAEFVAHLERQMPSWLELYGIPGAALALVRDGEVVWSDAFGYADLDRRRELTSDAVF